MYHIRPGILKLAVTASMLLWASIAVTPATAAQENVHFSGSVTGGDPSLYSIFLTNQTVSGSFTYNNSPLDTPGANDNDVDLNIGHYNNVITALTLNIGGSPYTATYGGPGSNYIEIKNQADIPGNFDRYEIKAPVSGSSVSGFSPVYLKIELIHTPGTFGNDSLAYPTLGNLFFPANFSVLFANNDASTNSLNGTLNSLTTPLPPAVILFGAGLVALIGLGAGSWRQKEHSPA